MYSRISKSILRTISTIARLVILLSLLPGSTFSVRADSGNITRAAAFNQLNLYPNIETAGVVVSGIDLPKTAELFYRLNGEINWRPAHKLMRIDDGRLVGSLFGLSPSTTYNIRVTDGITEITGSVTTQPEELSITPFTTLHVNANALASGDGSAAAPYRTIQEAVNRAGPGTQVLVADGIYRETVSFPNSGNTNNWIQVKAAGNGAILDGSETLSGNVWQLVEGKNNIWFTRINTVIGYLGRDGKRFYQYNDMNGLNNSAGHNNVTIRDGWFFEPSTSRLYIRSQDNPNTHSWQVPRLNHAFDVIARDWIWIEGFETRFYGTRTDGCGVCALNASHLVIRRNRIHNMQLGIFIQWNGSDSQGNDTRIEFNEVYDASAASWEWSAIKSGPMEGTGIIVRGHIGAIVRGNEVHHVFNGIYTGTSGAAGENPAIAFDADIYNNRIHHIGDDGLEPEGACINHRFRNNIVDGTLAGISLAPITFGPVWVTRSVFANFTSKAVKWDRNSDGIVYFYHNTSWTNSPDASGMELISPVKNTILRNNIFQVNGFSFTEKPTGSTNNDWNYNNWHSTRTSSNPHFKWENINYDRIWQLCSKTSLECNGYDVAPGLVNPGGGNFSLLVSSPNVNRGVLIPGINDSFGGSAPDVGAFEFQTSPPPTQTQIPTASPTATQISATLAPTIQPSLTPFPPTGLPSTQVPPSPTPFPLDSPPMVLSVTRMDASPTNSTTVRFRVTFSENVTGVDLFAPIIDFALNTTGLTGASITGITAESGASFVVQVNTGSGNGTIQLYPLDDDSIRDSLGQPLGGAGTGNGNFLTSEIYTINKTPITLSAVFSSNGANDGWVLESGEESGRGGTKNSNATIFNLGDNAQDRQYRSILHFQTSTLPDNAVITKATLMIRSAGLVGRNPFETHQYLLVDICSGAFGFFGGFPYKGLQVSDFESPSSRDIAGVIQNNPTDNWFWTSLDSSALRYISLAGNTQFRLRFQIQDNDDLGDDYLKFYSGEYSSPASRPQLIVEYYVP